MKRESRIYPYLLSLLFVVLVTLAAGPAARGAPAATDDWLGVMPPSPGLLERVERGEAELPQVMTDADLRRSLGVNQPAALIQPSGSWRAIALLVQFTDNPAATGASYFDSMLFSTGTGTLKDYFSEVSYGTLDIVTVNLPSSIGWMTMPQTYAYYVAGNNGFGSYPRNAQKLAEDAVWAANSVVNYANYDNNGNGYVDSLFIIHAGSGAELTGSPNDIWSHRWSMANDPFVDGVTLNGYTMEPEYWFTPGDMTVGVYAHELAHAFGLPDLYDTDNTSEGIGRWALMASGSWNGTLGSSPAWFSAWSRAFLGFVSPTNVVSNSTGVSIPAAESSQTVYRLWTNGSGGNEYFLVENRQPVGYDAALPGSGVLIWHIDESKNSNRLECKQLNNWNCGSNHLWVALEQADGLFDLENKVNRGDVRDSFPGATNNSNFDFGTAPNSSSYYHSSDTCIGVNNISSSAATMTADITVACQLPTISGYVRTSGGAGIGGVVMNGLPGNPTTAASGFYSADVAEGWSGTVQPLSAGLTFTPVSRVYSNVTSDLTNQDFSGANMVTAEFSGTPRSGVASLTVNFTDLSSGDYDSCLWNFGDGTNKICGNISHNYSSGGVYTVGLTVSGAGGSDTVTKVGYITVYDPVTANFNGTPTAGTTPLTVNFNNSSSGDAATCLWTFGDGTTSTSCGDPAHTYVTSGEYSVSLTVNGLGGDSDTLTRINYIHVNQGGAAAFSGTPVVGPAPLTVNFSNNSAGDIASCLWEFGDLTTSSSCGNPNHTYTQAGKYTVSLTVIDLDGASNTETRVEYIFAGAPVAADFSSAPTSGHTPFTVNFTNLSSGDYDSCLWTFGDGSSSNSCGNPSHIYANKSVYNVSLTVSGAGGSAIESKIGQVAVYDPVTANFSGTPTVGTAPLTVNFSNLSGGDANSCLWEFGDGNTSNSCGNPGHTYSVAGNYTVSLTVNGLGGDSSTETKVAYVLANEPVAAVFSASPTEGPAALAVNFSNGSTGEYDTCLWEFGDGNSSSDCNNPSHTYAAPGIYTVSLMVSGVGGSDEKTLTDYITVAEAGAANFSVAPLNGIAPLAVKFTNSSSGAYDSCLWTFGDGSSSNNCNAPSHVYVTPGIYSVTVAIDGSGGADSVTYTDLITVYDPVVANFSASPTAGAKPLLVNFSNLSSGNYATCHWDFGDGSSSSSCANQSHIYSIAGKYTVQLTASGLGGSKHETKVDYVVVNQYWQSLPLVVLR